MRKITLEQFLEGDMPKVELFTDDMLWVDWFSDLLTLELYQYHLLIAAAADDRLEKFMDHNIHFKNSLGGKGQDIYTMGFSNPDNNEVEGWISINAHISTGGEGLGENEKESLKQQMERHSWAVERMMSQAKDSKQKGK